MNSPYSLCVELPYRPPFDWPAFLRFLAHRAIEGVEVVEEERYLRTLRITSQEKEYIGWLQLRIVPCKDALQLDVAPALADVLPQVIARIEHLADLHCDPGVVLAALGTVAVGNPGLRVPGAVDGFELAVRAILGQQISVRAARTLAGRFALAFGQAIDAPGLHAVFPRAADVARQKAAAIAKIGVVATRAQAIIDIASALENGALDLRPGAGVVRNMAALKSIRGVGEWTAQYIAMRALAWRDAFPHADLALLKALGGITPKAALVLSEQWRPWRAYAVMHLWYSLRGNS